MATIKNQNFAFKQPTAKPVVKLGDDGKSYIAELANNDVFKNCNLSQREQNTEICPGVTGLTFKNCNLRNCKLPADAKYEGSKPYQLDIPADPVPDPDVEIRSAIKHLGEDDLLRIIGKEKAKEYFNLKEV